MEKMNKMTKLQYLQKKFRKLEKKFDKNPQAYLTNLKIAKQAARITK